MYVSPDIQTKKELREAVRQGKEVTVFNPGLGSPPRDGKRLSVEGPHYPKPHAWYAEVDVLNGVVVKVY